jgi:hypothetical protein
VTLLSGRTEIVYYRRKRFGQSIKGFAGGGCALPLVVILQFRAVPLMRTKFSRTKKQKASPKFHRYANAGAEDRLTTGGKAKYEKHQYRS